MSLWSVQHILWNMYMVCPVLLWCGYVFIIIGMIWFIYSCSAVMLPWPSAIIRFLRYKWSHPRKQWLLPCVVFRSYLKIPKTATHIATNQTQQCPANNIDGYKYYVLWKQYQCFNIFGCTNFTLAYFIFPCSAFWPPFENKVYVIPGNFKWSHTYIWWP